MVWHGTVTLLVVVTVLVPIACSSVHPATHILPAIESGAAVKVLGLRAAKYNGMTGHIVKGAQRAGRYIVQLDNDMRLSVERKNLVRAGTEPDHTQRSLLAHDSTVREVPVLESASPPEARADPATPAIPVAKPPPLSPSTATPDTVTVQREMERLKTAEDTQTREGVQRWKLADQRTPLSHAGGRVPLTSASAPASAVPTPPTATVSLPANSALHPSISKEAVDHELQRLRAEGTRLRTQKDLVDLRSRHRLLQKQLQHNQQLLTETLHPGARVVLHGLKSDDHNGRRAIVISTGLEEGRVMVALEGSDANFAVKPDNMSLQSEDQPLTTAGAPDATSMESVVTEVVPEGTSAHEEGQESTPPSPPSPVDDPGDTDLVQSERLRAGRRVILEGLEAAQYNGQRGTLVGMKPGTDRYEVELSGSKKKIAVRSTNIQIDLTPATMRSELKKSKDPFADLSDDELREALKKAQEAAVTKTALVQHGTALDRFPLESRVMFTNFGEHTGLPDLNTRDGVVVGTNPQSRSLIVRVEGKGPDVEVQPEEISLMDEVKQRTVHNTATAESHDNSERSVGEEDDGHEAAVRSGHGQPHRRVLNAPFFSGILRNTLTGVLGPKPQEKTDNEVERHRQYMQLKGVPGTRVVLRGTREQGTILDRSGSDFVVRLSGNRKRTVAAEDIEIYSRLLAYLNEE